MYTENVSLIGDEAASNGHGSQVAVGKGGRVRVQKSGNSRAIVLQCCRPTQLQQATSQNLSQAAADQCRGKPGQEREHYTSRRQSRIIIRVHRTYQHNPRSQVKRQKDQGNQHVGSKAACHGACMQADDVDALPTPREPMRLKCAYGATSVHGTESTVRIALHFKHPLHPVQMCTACACGKIPSSSRGFRLSAARKN